MRTPQRVTQSLCTGGALAVLAAGLLACADADLPGLLIAGGTVYDGSGADPVLADVLIDGSRIAFVGDAGEAGVRARDTIDATGLMVTPGFIDMHSHVELEEDYGRAAEIFLYQGITTAVIGVDGGGTPEISDMYARMSAEGVGLNVVSYVGHGAVRQQVLGLDDRPPTDAELEQMRALVRQGMEEGAFGLSSGLFYVPGFYAETEEVIELGKIAAEYGGIYDTHDRDLGAAYRGIGYLNSIREAIRIGEESGTRVIFSHFNAQGRANYGRANEGAALIDSARARGLEVAGAQHVYTATMSSLRAYAIPRWAAAGGPEQMVRRFSNPDTASILDTQTMEMLEIRGGPEKILFADPRPELNGKTLAEVAAERDLSVPETVREILAEDNAWVMNLELYDAENTRFLATRSWMMTVTDGATPLPDQGVTHPRAYGAFPRKIRLFVEEGNDISMAFAIRSMTGLAADFLRLGDRGYVRKGMWADVAVFDRARINDPATYENPHQNAEGLVHLFVNGVAAISDGRATGALAGVPVKRAGGP
ncbi:MAG: amidohydrolase family protein [Gemmatimonadota bacterium]